MIERAGRSRECHERRARALTISVDVVLLTVLDAELQALLVTRPDLGPDRCRALPGSPVGTRESLDAAAIRVVAAVAGVDVHLEQLRTYSDPDRDPRARVVSAAYLGLVPGLPAARDHRAAALWPVAEAGDGNVALVLDHGRILADGIERARSKLEYTSLAAAFVEEPFTLGDLRRVYEAVWGASLDPGNFRRKVLSTQGFVEPVVGRTAPRPGGGRPGRLYRRGRSRLLHPAMLRPGCTSQRTSRAP